MNKCAPFVLACSLCTAAWAEDAPVKQHIDVNSLNGGRTQVIENVVVPVPSEIFAVLDKQGKPGWIEVLRPLKGEVKAQATKEQDALMMGLVIAEGFVAVEATNAEEVKNIGRSVLSLSQPLGVRKEVTRRANAITESADKSDWKQVRKELDGALSDVKTAMNRLQNQDLAQLVSLAGWLRGTEALTMVVEKNYSKDGAELLHQPILLEFFKGRLEGMRSDVKKDPLVAKVKRALGDLEPLMGGEEPRLDEETVKKIQVIATDAIKSINQKTNP